MRHRTGLQPVTSTRSGDWAEQAKGSSSSSGLKFCTGSADKAGVDGDPALERLYDRYRVVVAAHRAQKRISGLRAAEAVIEARVMLYEHLVASGWDPPEELRRQLELDALLAEQPPGELTG